MGNFVIDKLMQCLGCVDGIGHPAVAVAFCKSARDERTRNCNRIHNDETLFKEQRAYTFSELLFEFEFLDSDCWHE